MKPLATLVPVATKPQLSGLAHLRAVSEMCDATIDEVRGRRIRIGDQWLADFASCNYLGLDLDPEIADRIAPEVSRWGTHPSWSRLLGSPRIYLDIEERLSDLLGAPDTLVLPTITQIHLSVLPALAGDGQIFMESTAHKTIYDGCVMSRGLGASVQRFHDLTELADLLRRAPAHETRLICMDGVNSMTGNIPELGEYVALAREHGARLYVDDAHGFGVIGERSDQESSPYGQRGNSIVRHTAQSYDDIILVGGFSKAYSSLLAFIALPTALKDHLKLAAAPYLYSGPSPTASLATVMAGFDVNEVRGDRLRADLHDKTRRVLNLLEHRNVYTPNTSGLPIIELPLATGMSIEEVGAILFRKGIYVTLAAYPLVPRDQVGFRVQITAANQDDEIDELCAVLDGLADAELLRRRDE
ncbi:pyridoxal phosphate-dependent aminotransferase family protein [Kineosporia mesophila]|uniref:8-amino-7-oxononanoate synthase n=1 Tax=Kineosporia mesophila TaxID=566012 RepID=A0ABP7ACG4_9ACTN|nr:pyridoxal phosphate-dependent aminotransferase family protein [Kineosporia mesophila]MCD5351232.1 pyridoxal phosphate-dependent aminotransferase family protein [Kineosporia mesophila]